MEQYNLSDTIYALSSGLGRGGVAVIRLSGKQVLDVLKKMVHLEKPKARYAYFKPIYRGRDILDQALVLYFPAPHSFTGEDVAEFQIHGGHAVIQAVLETLGEMTGCRPAERGEFSRRAVINGKMDLTEAEGLLDLINAETERQRGQALSQMQGELGHLYDGWRQDLMHHMAYLEAFIDFPEEEIPPEKADLIDCDVKDLIQKIQSHLNDNRAGEKLREGFQIALIGAPNVGKSSLMNALVHKDVAIVSQMAGTTRDVVEAHLDVDGFPVILADTAGLRDSAGDIEAEGIRRAVQRATDADLILFVQDIQKAPQGDMLPDALKNKTVLTVWNKADLKKSWDSCLCVSAKTGIGISTLWTQIKSILKNNFMVGQSLITRERYRVALDSCVQHLSHSLTIRELELKAEDLRLAARALGRITGQIGAEDLLDVIFRDFCIGK
ncbi:MAG: tRNA uridine-5-carboxymethylaminomethyl(34) synthesis GTPase MnmE [Pseudomonadota bacterium]|nr:tRNA uridine-5-carboxymethylaminomethyl(34) synthesis GTPase MnmE [Pseudomonadota bacterium]